MLTGNLALASSVHHLNDFRSLGLSADTVTLPGVTKILRRPVQLVDSC